MQKGSGFVRFAFLFRPGSDFDWRRLFWLLLYHRRKHPRRTGICFSVAPSIPQVVAPEMRMMSRVPQVELEDSTMLLQASVSSKDANV
jgi:hypothetical protein